VNAPLRRAAVFCLVLFGLLILNANYLQVVKADDYRNKPGNKRLLLEEYSRQRGAILVGGKAVASSKLTDDKLKYLRQYPQGRDYAAATGFYSFLIGSSGIESAENSFLAGTDDRLFVRRVVDLLSGKESRGGAVKLTLNAEAQKAAIKGLQGKKGAVIALQPSTGRILAMATSPSYDPNKLSSHDGKAIQATWNALNKDKDKPLDNRALRTRYPPGSTFKIVTLAAALSEPSGQFRPDTEVEGPASLPLPKSTKSLPNENGQPCGNGHPTLTVALEQSCNTVFGKLGIDIGADAVQKQAEKFGFNSELNVPLPTASSVFPSDLDGAQTALSSIGQFNVQATPLQDAMVVAAVANNGTLMKPYLVDEVLSPDGNTLEKTNPEALHKAVSSEVASEITQMMVSVVENGTGRNARIDGVEVAGKTGTAQHGKGTKPHAWFMSFAPAQDAKVAVAVVIEDGAENSDDISGGRLAAPIAKSVTEAVLNQ
jgi:peptidoglycan glycosyltransferase